MKAENKKDRSKRFPIRQMIDISNNREEYISSSGINISQTGILCEIGKEVDLLSRIYILLQHPSSEESLEIEAIVIRLEKKGKHFLAGMKFAYDDSEFKKNLKRFIKKLSQ